MDSLLFDVPPSLTAQIQPVTQSGSFIFKTSHLWTPHAQPCPQSLSCRPLHLEPRGLLEQGQMGHIFTHDLQWLPHA